MPKKARSEAVRSATGKPRAVKAAPTYEEIQLRAYELYVNRQGAPGDPLEDWVRAERELLEKTPKNGRSKNKAAA